MRTPAVGLVERIAILEATEGRFGEISPDHLLLAVLKLADMPPGRVSEFTRHPTAVKEIGAEIEKLREELNRRRILITLARRSLRTKLGKGGEGVKEGEIPPRSPAAKSIFDSATKRAMERSNPLNSLMLLECLLEEASPAAKGVLAASQGENPPLPPDPERSDQAPLGPHGARAAAAGNGGPAPATPAPYTPAPGVTPSATPPAAGSPTPAVSSTASVVPAGAGEGEVEWQGLGIDWAARARGGEVHLPERPRECQSLVRLLRQSAGRSIALVCEEPELGRELVLAFSRLVAQRKLPGDLAALRYLIELPAEADPELGPLEGLTASGSGLLVTLAPAGLASEGLALPAAVRGGVRAGRLRTVCTVDAAGYRRLTADRGWRRVFAFLWLDRASPREIPAAL